MAPGTDVATAACWLCLDRQAQGRHGGRGCSAADSADSGGSRITLQWLTWDSSSDFTARPTRVDGNGKLVWAHPINRRSYTDLAPAGRGRSCVIRDAHC
jgi:hypothetical protein